jgi:3-phosphoshikimate 1-carboxyvinyltransferase
VTVPDEVMFGGVRPLRGALRLPGDKSISHRSLLFAALADGASTITHLATGEDVAATAAALAQMGVSVRAAADAVVVEGRGIDAWSEPVAEIDCGNSGTTMRVLSGALASRPFLSILTGDASLLQRPMRRIVDPLRAMGATIDGRDGGEHAPLSIRGGALRGRRHELPVASAQVKSCLVLAGLRAEGETEIVSPGQSRDHTERMLAALGAPVGVEGYTVRVSAGAPRAFDLDVPGDPSSAAFFVVAAAITPGSDMVLTDVSCNPTRTGFLDVLLRMGADIEVRVTGESCGEPRGEVRVRASALRATTIEGDEIANVIDEIPALGIAAAFADGVTNVRNAEELAVKESNRIGTLHAELNKLGAGSEARADGLVIRGGAPHAAVFDSHGDHRVAMAMAVAANAIDGQSTVQGWRAVASSYPEFADHLALLTGGAP